MADQEALPLEGDLYGEGAALSGAPLMIAHGLFGSASNWRSAAKRLAATRPVVALDLRNHGASPWAASMDYASLGADLIGEIDRRFDGEAILLGHSMGGKAAMAAALLAPQKVRGLIVVDIAPVAYDHPEHRLIAQAMLRVDLAALNRRSDAEAALKEAAPDPAMRAFLLQNLAFDGPERRARWKPNVAGVAAAMDDIIDWPATLGGASYAGPTVSIRGGASKYVAADGLEAMRRLFPALDTVAIEGAGHWPHAEAPEVFLDEVERFLASI